MIRLVALADACLGLRYFRRGGRRTATLSSEQLAKAIKTDSITIPTPGELFAALEKRESLIGRVNIAPQFR